MRMSSYEANWARERRDFLASDSFKDILNRDRAKGLHMTGENEGLLESRQVQIERLAVRVSLTGEDVVAFRRNIVITV